jgi:hypothetical protein
MNDTSDSSQPIEEAVIEPSAESKPGETPTGDAAMIIELETIIKNNISTIARSKVELKRIKEMFESALTNDSTYRDAVEKVKEATKAKGKAKLAVMENPQTKQLNEKIKDAAQEIKDASLGISEYLREYQRLSGATEITTDDGETLEIVTEAKLVKKSKKF